MTKFVSNEFFANFIYFFINRPGIIFEQFSKESKQIKRFSRSEKWKIIYMKKLVYSAAEQRIENYKGKKS